MNASVRGETEPTAPQAFSPIEPTTISARLRSIASITASPMSAAVRLADPGGGAMPASAKNPASRMMPGQITETPTPASRRS